MNDERIRLQIGQFAELVGLSVPQLRRYDRMDLLAPAARSESGYRYYSNGQAAAGRVIALLRSLDMPIAEVRRMLSGVTDDERTAIISEHRGRLEARLDEVRRLLEAVDRITETEENTIMDSPTALSSWLHLMPRLPVSDVDASASYYEEALGFRVAWQTADGELTALASGAIELLLLVPWRGAGTVPPQSAYVYVEDPHALCAEYEAAGATIVEPVASRDYGMRDFVVADPDGHRFTLGRGEDRLRDVADHYGLEPDEINVDPDWMNRRR